MKIVLAGVLALGLAACEKKPSSPPVAKTVTEPVKVPVAQPPVPAPVEQKAAPSAAQPAESNADQALTAKVKAALGEIKGFDARGIDVQSADGEVQLFGTVDNAAQSAEAAKAAARVPGVKSVKNHLAVVSGS
ncbi:MAG TPA: BON domain-containing protein [Burkholderiales bacterium]|nr:BON domain-containing protein [Burkholderiales bacterium]